MSSIVAAEPKAARTGRAPLLTGWGRGVLATVLVVHALPHLMGTLLAWSPPQNCADPSTLGCTHWLELPTWTTIPIALGWALAAAAMLWLAVLSARASRRLHDAMLVVVLFSTALCLIGLPNTQIGLAVNVALLGFWAARSWIQRRR